MDIIGYWEGIVCSHEYADVSSKHDINVSDYYLQYTDNFKVCVGPFVFKFTTWPTTINWLRRLPFYKKIAL